MKTFLLSLIAVMTLATFPAFALELADAKAQGLVGEMSNGLIGPVVGTGTAEVQTLVKNVNNGRTEIYIQNAKQQNLSIDQVQVIAGEKLQAVTPAGQYIQKNGKWSKK